MSKTLHLPDEASAPPKAETYLSVGFSGGTHRKHSEFDGARRPLHRGTGARNSDPLENALYLGRTPTDPLCDLANQNSVIPHGGYTSFQRSKVLHTSP